MIPKPCTVLLLSGGLDSVTAMYAAIRDGVDVHALIFDYGQTHRKEIGFALWHCEALKVPHTMIELHPIKGLFSRSTLTDGQGSVIVANRNMVLISIAVSIAMTQGADSVSIACNKNDHDMFPDCRYRFLSLLDVAVKMVGTVSLKFPFVALTKREIVSLSRDLMVPIDKTWSCYTGEEEACGTCHACVARNAALVS